MLRFCLSVTVFFSSMSALPVAVDDWTAEHVREWLHQNSQDDLLENFRGMYGATLLKDSSDEFFQKELGISDKRKRGVRQC